MNCSVSLPSNSVVKVPLGRFTSWWSPSYVWSVVPRRVKLYGACVVAIVQAIKTAFESTEEERALLRARPAAQRFPVVEWRQRMEDFRKRSIDTSRHHAGSNAWRPRDRETAHAPAVAMLDHDDWDPVHQPEPTQPQWDYRSMMDSAHISHVPGSSLQPSSPGGWSQSTLAPQEQGLLAVPPRIDYMERRQSTSSDDYFSAARSRVASTVGTPTAESPGGGYENFLSRANTTFAKDQRHAPDPFLDKSATF